MADRKPTLDYAPPPDPKPWPTWIVLTAMVLWPLIVLDIWGVAFISVTFTVLGIVNLFHPVSGLGTDGPGTIHWTKASWLICSALLAAIFVPLAMWHWRWHRRNRTPAVAAAFQATKRGPRPSGELNEKEERAEKKN